MIVGEHIQWNSLCDVPSLHGIMNRKVNDFIQRTDPTFGGVELTYYYQIDFYNSDVIIKVYQYVDGIFSEVNGCGCNNTTIQTQCVVTPTSCDTNIPIPASSQPYHSQPQSCIPLQSSGTNDHTKLVNLNGDSLYQHVSMAMITLWNSAVAHISQLVGAHKASAISLDTTTFDKNLDSSVDDVQKLAEKVDELVLGTTQLQSDLAQTDTNAPDFVKNKDTDNITEGDNNLYFTDQRAIDAVSDLIPTNTSDLTNDSGFITIGDVPAQIQSDMSQSNTSAVDYIKNKTTSNLKNDSGFITIGDVPIVDVLGTTLTGLTVAEQLTSILSTDSILTAFGKIQKHLSSLKSLAYKTKADWNTDIDNIPGTFPPAAHSHSTYQQITLTSAGWTNKQQTVAVTGATATNTITISPEKTRANYIAYGSAQISCIAQSTDSVTFECTTLPTINITVNIEIK